MADKITPIFIFSLRRSGSTLCQRILASDANISAAGEPHILLPLLYSIKDRGVYSEYDHKVTAQAIKDFASTYRTGWRNTLLKSGEPRYLYMGKPGMGVFDISWIKPRCTI